jgi:LruC domain-containing protein
MKNLISLTFVFLMLLAGCSKNNDSIPEDNQDSIDKLEIPNGFAYETSSEIDYEINMPENVDFSVNKTRFNIYASDQPEEAKLISSGSFSDDGQYKGSLVVPSSQTELYVQTIAGDVVVSVNGTNKEDGVIIDFGDDYGYFPPDTVEPAFKSQRINANSGMNTLKDIQTNVIGNGDFSTNDFGQIPAWSTTIPVDGKWYFTKYSWMNKMEWLNEGGNGMIKTPTNAGYNYYYGGASQWVVADPGDVITLSANIKGDGANSSMYSYLYLIPRTSSGSILAYYNVSYYRPSNSWVNKTLVASMPSGTAYCQVLLYNNDYDNNHSVYYDNVVVTGPITDIDGDGVSDEDDDYPSDPARAFNIYYPDASSMSSIAFEDNWPGKGDYDFNDMVIDYQYKEVVNSSNQLVDLFADFKFMAAGATLLNGFGFEMGMAPGVISSVSGTSLVDGYINTSANGTEANQSKACVIVTDNIFTQLSHPGSGIGVNTTPGSPYVEPSTLSLEIHTSSPVSLSAAGRPPYNPFMIVNQIRGREVHLPNHTPTSLVDASYFGTEHDDTNPATGKYYMTERNLPWAINLPVNFDYPVEKKEIIAAYLHFGDWAESAGTNFTNWYGNETGYRNAANVYVVPE